MQEALISVIIPIYNTATYLRRCILSAREQTYCNLEILLVDDGSTDESSRICDEAAAEDSRIQVIHRPNGGLSAALNCGLDRATGEYIFILDGDDAIDARTIEILYDAAISTGSDVACSGYFDGMRYIYCLPDKEVLPSKEALTRMLSRQGLDSNMAGKLVRSSLFRDIHFPVGRLFENVPVTYRLIMNAETIVLTGFGGYFVSIREGSLTRSPFEKKHMDFIIFTKELADNFSEQSDIRPYADCFYYDALVTTALRAYVNPLDRRSAEVKSVISSFKKSFLSIVRNKYLSRRQKILAILCRFHLIRPLWGIYSRLRARRISRISRSKEKKKSGILLVAPNGLSPTGGVERVCYYLHRVFSRYGEVRVVTNDDVIRKYRFLESRILRKNPVLICAMMSWYINRIRSRTDLVVSNGYAAPFVAADILFQHGTMRAYADAFGRKRIDIRRVTELLERSAARKAKRIFVVAQHVSDEITRFYHAKLSKIRVINNCVDTEIFTPNPEKVFDPANIRILFCGRLDKAKGLDQLVQIAQCIENRKGFRLIIATTGELNTDRFAGLEKTRISVKIPVDELRTFYNSGDVLLLPSVYEGFEMVTTESLSCGVPVVGNQVGAIDELLSRKAPGVYRLNSDVPDEILSQLQTVAAEFSEISRRNHLHSYMERNFGVPIYEACIDRNIAQLFSQRKDV